MAYISSNMREKRYLANIEFSVFISTLSHHQAASLRREGACVEPIVLAEKLAALAHEATISLSTRPLGVSCLLSGFDSSRRAQLLRLQANGGIDSWRAVAIGRRSEVAMKELTQRLTLRKGQSQSQEEQIRSCFEALKKANDQVESCEVCAFTASGALRRQHKVSMGDFEPFRRDLVDLLKDLEEGD